ncbi:MAG TPA: hypothetical protein DEB39_12530 [Planctomycetaceae bacterium]|nr:hypothetical protein [Planctomycetaceae bacterium]
MFAKQVQAVVSGRLRYNQTRQIKNDETLVSLSAIGVSMMKRNLHKHPNLRQYVFANQQDCKKRNNPQNFCRIFILRSNYNC